MTEENIIADIEKLLAHQLKWRSINFFGYSAITVFAIVASTGATITAGMGMSQIAAVLAGAATIFYGLEKSLMLRERWAHHLRMVAQLENVRLEVIYSGLDSRGAVKKMSEAMENYADRVPVSPEARPAKRAAKKK